jgi:hypothetical protein
MSRDSLHECSAGLGAADVLELQFLAGSKSSETQLLLKVLSNGNVRSFRFHAPQELAISSCFPRVGWLQILDIRGRQLDRLGVSVSDGEQSEAIRFYARSVEEITDGAEQAVAADRAKPRSG